ncbi:hypothetical protein LY76DRAFT_42122 [Colletotrichum caudatum]|nr:hypothetical protein LY76DRAFT_42122 [Colletotrichum caudatum]
MRKPYPAFPAPLFICLMRQFLYKLRGRVSLYRQSGTDREESPSVPGPRQPERTHPELRSMCLLRPSRHCRQAAIPSSLAFFPPLLACPDTSQVSTNKTNGAEANREAGKKHVQGRRPTAPTFACLTQTPQVLVRHNFL